MSQKIRFVNSPICQGLLALSLAVGLGCSSDGSGNGTGGSSSSASGGTGSGGSRATGGSTASGGSGGKSSAGGTTTAGTTSGGGNSASGGTIAAGGGSGLGGGPGSTGGSGQAGGVTSAGGSSAGGSSMTGGSSAKTGGTGAGGSAAGGSSAGSDGGNAGDAKPSTGCGKTPSKLKNNPPGSNGSSGGTSTVNTITVGGQNREFLVRWPTDYKNDTPYRIILGLHGAGGTWQESGLTNYGLWSLSKDTTIFVSLSALAKFWDGPTDLLYTDEVLKLVESELCIDTSRVMLEGFSQGAAMSWYLTCSRPNVFRAVVGHSGGGVNPIPSTCSPVAYLGTLGTQESGNGQNTQTDRFAKVDGCTIETLPTASTGKHVCTPYKNCQPDFPVTWCSFDGGHGFEPRDSGASTSWVPQVVWDFLSPL